MPDWHRRCARIWQSSTQRVEPARMIEHFGSAKKDRTEAQLWRTSCPLGQIAGYLLLNRGELLSRRAQHHRPLGNDCWINKGAGRSDDCGLHKAKRRVNAALC